MSIFQKSIVKKHISSENQEVLKAKWNLFTSYFHNVTIQENIYNSKEEQFQEGFLRELFVLKNFDNSKYFKSILFKIIFLEFVKFI